MYLADNFSKNLQLKINANIFTKKIKRYIKYMVRYKNIYKCLGSDMFLVHGIVHWLTEFSSYFTVQHPINRTMAEYDSYFRLFLLLAECI